MRWHFLDPPTSGDTQRRRAAERQIDRWWRAFAAHAEAIDDRFVSRGDFDLVGFMDEYLHAISPHLMWEYGRAVSKPGHRLVITPESAKGLRPVVETLLGQAPSLDRWEFYGYRLPEPNSVHAMVEARLDVRVPRLRGAVTRGMGNTIDLSFAEPGVADVDTLWRVALVASETLVGEEVLDKWVGAISPVQPPDPSFLEMEELSLVVDRLREDLLSELPSQPFHEVRDDIDWSLFELQPDEAFDYPQQRDLFVGTTASLEMSRAIFRGLPFASCRFSRCGETFCYVKLDGTGRTQNERMTERSYVEGILDEALIPAGLGCHVGGGTGLRYSYINLALTDVAAAIPRIKEVLRQHRAPARTWLLFFDDVWCDEWIGVWDTTPPPPREDGA